MSTESWVCQRCGKVGGFHLMGDGFIMCPACGAWHVITASNKVLAVGKRTPELLPFVRAREAGQT